MKKLTEHKGVKLTEVTTEVKIDATPKEVWDALSHFGDVSSFHGGVEKSVTRDGGSNKAEMGAERVCDILDGKREVVLVERIIEFEEGSHYRYEVFEWENFPLKMMFFGFAIEKDMEQNTILQLVINYRLKPGFMTNLMKWKIKKMEKEILIGYKNYIETGERKVPIGELKKKNYKFV